MSKKEIDELVTQCEALGWKVKPSKSGGTSIISPPGGDPIITPRTAGGRSLGNFKADLRRAGFNPEAAEAAQAEKAAVAITKDREKNEAALARAARRAQESILAPAAPPKPPTLANPFAAPAVAVEPPLAPIADPLTGYPRSTVFVTQPMARVLLVSIEENNRKHQRNLYDKTWKRYQLAMELGEWELNPADSLVLDKDGNLVNGQHRMKGLAEADPEFIDTYYPNGVPFELTTGFPPELAHIFDVGKARSASDALTVEGLVGWGPMLSAALRLVLLYDQSFRPDGVSDWARWRHVPITNTELVAAASGAYSGLRADTKTVSRAFTRSKLTRSATTVAVFLFNRDNPGGNPKAGLTNELFWRGVCDDDAMAPGDPRRAIIRVSTRTTARYRADNGPITLAYLLKAYAKYMTGKSVELLGTPDELKQEPMLPVWTPRLRWDGKKLIPMKRFSE